ncbi:MAG: hypothetical protein Q8867_00315 [Bacteroidota bacterium]|nr:hypothetical protein [Bacteroidota bacterium]
MNQKSNNQEKFLRFRKEFPEFTYSGFEYRISSNGLHVKYSFDLSGKYFFHPTLTIPYKQGIPFREIPVKNLENLLFQIGMIELVSYWKVACPPCVKIAGYHLDKPCADWWKKLYFNGLGEFFYLNSIQASPENFMDLCFNGIESPEPFRITPGEGGLIPVGGGKDSAVTLELLHGEPGNIPVILNPRGASLDTLRVRGIGENDFIGIQRTIDPELIRLNGEGFLNGHTPFSALLAFITSLAAVLSGKKYIILSNESSANEPTVLEKEINHQYSKTYKFEKDFRDYFREYVTPDIEYFSFLRPVNELQIAHIFSGFPQYFPVFKSCNVGSKTDTWCGHCAKCLFTWIILSPFVSREKLITIFGRDLFSDLTLIPLLEGLTGSSETKPFDCIGTVNEVNTALKVTLRQYGDADLPGLLRFYRSSSAFTASGEEMEKQLIHHYNPEHFVPDHFLKILKGYIHD